MDSNKEYKTVNATFQGLQELIESSSTHLFPENVKNCIVKLSEQFQLKKELKLTFCIICDKLGDKSTLIDALLKEKVSDHLSSDRQYLVKSDPSIQKTIIDDENQELCTITVEKERLKLLDNSNFMLSFEKYSQFMKDIQKSDSYKPDVVVLVVNSPKDLEKDYIQSFFNSIENQFNDENFILVLNEGRSADCTATNICDICYPSNIRHLFSGHKLENRGFKISATRCLNFQFRDNSDVLDENYQDLFKTLKEELDINHVMNRFKQQADNIKKEIDSILQTIKVENLKTSINEYDNKLNEKLPNILKGIETHQSKSINDVNEMFKTKKNQNNRKSVLKTFLNEKCIKIYNNLQNDVINLSGEISSKDCIKIVGSLSKNMLNDHGLNEENIKKKSYELFDEFIEKQYPQNSVEETVNEEKNNEGFISSAIKITKGIFGYAKDKLNSFKNSFKDKATSIVKEAETHIKEAIRKARFNPDFETFKIKLRNKMKQSENDLSDSLKRIIEKYDKINLFGNNNFKSECMSTINKETLTMMDIEDEIKIFFASSFKFTNENCADYFKKYFPKTDFENFRERCKTKLNNYNKNIQDDKYYNFDITIPGKTIGAVAGATTGALITAPIPILMPVGVFVGGYVGSFLGRGKDIEIHEKFLKFPDVLNEIKTLNVDLSKETDEIIEKLVESMKIFVSIY